MPDTVVRDEPYLTDYESVNMNRAGIMSFWFALCRQTDSRWVNYPWWRLMDTEVLWSER